MLHESGRPSHKDHAYEPLGEHASDRSIQSAVGSDDSPPASVKCVGCFTRCMCCYRNQYGRAAGIMIVLQFLTFLLCMGQIAFIARAYSEASGASVNFSETEKEAHILYEKVCAAVAQLRTMGLTNLTACPVADGL